MRPRPILLAILDGWGLAPRGPGNAVALAQTPNMDRLVREGMHFTDAHTPSAVCTPTRYGILTGRYCWRSRLKSGVLVGVDRKSVV